MEIYKFLFFIIKIVPNSSDNARAASFPEGNINA